MNYFDCNVSLGPWPFRRIIRHHASELREDLEELGCLGALVCNNGALLYADTREGNRELAEKIAPHRDFFVGCATIDPTWPQAEKELDECIDTLGFRALRLLPQYHDYNLTAALPLVRHAGMRHIPIVIPSGIVDFRQRHRLEPDAFLAFEDVRKLAQDIPETYFLWLDAVLPEDAPENVYGELNRGRPIPSSRLLFGSGMPLRSPAAYLKVKHLQCSSQMKQWITRKNFQHLFLEKQNAVYCPH